VPTAGEGNRLKSAKDGQYNAYYITLHDNNVTQFTVKQSNYINATNRLSNRMTYLLITLAPSSILSQIPHTLFDIISLGVKPCNVRRMHAKRSQALNRVINDSCIAIANCAFDGIAIGGEHYREHCSSNAE